MRPELPQALADAAVYAQVGPVTTHETHASWVFVVGERAYKVKKPLKLDFLDYSTLARRHAACREEVRVNRELAPGIYLGVRALVQRDGRLALAREDAPGALEFAVEMRRFREQDTLAGLIDAGALEIAQIDAVAARLAAFHRGASRVADGSVETVLEMWRANSSGLARAAAGMDLRAAPSDRFAEACVRALAEEIEARRSAGLARDGHGDLRCEHVLAVGEVRVVDRIEFDRSLRVADVACDLAFLTMDLEARGQRWAARSLLAAYRQAGMHPGSDALQAFYAAYRAFVRAKVALVGANEREGPRAYEQLWRARELCALGERLCWRARAPLALVVCGPAASGKSTLARALSGRSGMSVVSSDAVRKALMGLPASARAAPEHYSEPVTRATYARLGELAAEALARTGGVIVDATCRTRVQRALLAQRLAAGEPTVLFVLCELPLEAALERARARLSEPARVSDATPAIVAEQHRAFEPPSELDECLVLALDMRAPLEEQLERVCAAVDARLRARPPA